MRKLAAGNWKMNGTGDNLSMISQLAAAHPSPKSEILICPPTPLIHRAATISDSITIGAQDCHAASKGAHTGDTSVIMLADAGATYVITGHSERRADHKETNKNVHAKATAILKNGLKPIICMGESLEQREGGNTLEVISNQLAHSTPDMAAGHTTVIAYEPIWAIGTGKIPTLTQIGEVHDFIRHQLQTRFGTAQGGAFRILYGGSVKPTNAAEIFAIPNVDGALVGGASLTVADFSPIITALDAA
ncbi:MAG: triose-phosphate isomerase [Rhodobacteraceae bacterium]|nr:triose-phosphate isomerase [Paracoccaceae bacterium]